MLKSDLCKSKVLQSTELLPIDVSVLTRPRSPKGTTFWRTTDYPCREVYDKSDIKHFAPGTKSNKTKKLNRGSSKKSLVKRKLEDSLVFSFKIADGEKDSSNKNVKSESNEPSTKESARRLEPMPMTKTTNSKQNKSDKGKQRAPALKPKRRLKSKSRRPLPLSARNVASASVSNIGNSNADSSQSMNPKTLQPLLSPSKLSSDGSSSNSNISSLNSPERPKLEPLGSTKDSPPKANLSQLKPISNNSSTTASSSSNDLPSPKTLPKMTLEPLPSTSKREVPSEEPSAKKSSPVTNIPQSTVKSTNVIKISADEELSIKTGKDTNNSNNMESVAENQPIVQPPQKQSSDQQSQLQKQQDQPQEQQQQAQKQEQEQQEVVSQQHDQPIEGSSPISTETEVQTIDSVAPVSLTIATTDKLDVPPNIKIQNVDNELEPILSSDSITVIPPPMSAPVSPMDGHEFSFDVKEKLKDNDPRKMSTQSVPCISKTNPVKYDGRKFQSEDEAKKKQLPKPPSLYISNKNKIKVENIRATDLNPPPAMPQSLFVKTCVGESNQIADFRQMAKSSKNSPKVATPTKLARTISTEDLHKVSLYRASRKSSEFSPDDDMDKIMPTRICLPSAKKCVDFSDWELGELQLKEIDPPSSNNSIKLPAINSLPPINPIPAPAQNSIVSEKEEASDDDKLQAINNGDPEAEKAAVKIQSIFKGKQDRERVKLMKIKGRKEMDAAATKVQSVFRGKKGREKVKKKQDQEMNKAATQVQRVFRGKRDRSKVKTLKAKKEDSAATTVQKVFRGRQARKIVNKKKIEMKNEKKDIMKSAKKKKSKRTLRVEDESTLPMIPGVEPQNQDDESAMETEYV
eukprot:TRINITY_DN89516_c0_g1_i1.p1 TRINITY_DN89516_c0_g1~~TRINITY_DN89516_c0_g1_i1.p1  ORF type:complete len:857 (-),score=261.62 TRINITY_DN89516_c0_g1_i1:54-2624(-)